MGIAVIGSTLLTLLITMCVTSGNKQSADPSKEKSNPKRSILRKAAPEGKHLIKKTSFAELPPEAMPSKASVNRLQVPNEEGPRYQKKSPPPSPSHGSDDDTEDDDISKRNKLLLNARKARESRSHIGHPSNVPDAELEEEKRV